MNAALKNILFLIASTLVGAVLMYGVYRGFDFATLGTFFSKRVGSSCFGSGHIGKRISVATLAHVARGCTHKNHTPKGY